jgi:hypothetical protein
LKTKLCTLFGMLSVMALPVVSQAQVPPFEVGSVVVQSQVDLLRQVQDLTLEAHIYADFAARFIWLKQYPLADFCAGYSAALSKEVLALLSDVVP